GRGPVRLEQQVFQRVGPSLGLDQLRALDPAGGADDRIAGADEDAGIRIDGPRALLQLADEAVVEAREPRLPRLAQVQLPIEEPECADRGGADERVLNLAEPSHEPAHATGYAPREPEVEGRPAADPLDEGHTVVTAVGYPFGRT